MSAELSQSPHTSPLSAADIDEAAQRISDVVARSPLQFSERLSEATGATVYLKREDLQAVRSYKLRGAHNLLMQLSDDEIAAGVVCSSAGNHAQGFAMACRSMGIHGRVYVPAKTPKQKRDRIRYHGRDFIELIAIAKPCAWLPADEHTTPAAISPSDSCISRLCAPRSLYDRTACRSSRLR